MDFLNLVLFIVLLMAIYGLSDVRTIKMLDKSDFPFLAHTSFRHFDIGVQCRCRFFLKPVSMSMSIDISTLNNDFFSSSGVKLIIH